LCIGVFKLSAISNWIIFGLRNF